MFLDNVKIRTMTSLPDPMKLKAWNIKPNATRLNEKSEQIRIAGDKNLNVKMREKSEQHK